MINKSIDDGIKSILNPRNRLILDVACGTGLFTRNLAKHTYHTWGIDISMEMLKQGSN